MSPLANGARLALGRLRGRWGVVAVVVTFTFSVGAAVAERFSNPSIAADQALLGAVFGIAVPLFAHALVGRALGGRRLSQGVDELSRHGADRRRATLGILGVAAVSCALASGALAVTAVVATTAPKPLVADALTTGWIGLLAGACYALLFAAASLGGAIGRLTLLAADWLLGASGTFVALACPRGHVRNLLGAEAPLDLPQWSAAVGLLVLGTIYASVTTLRTPR